MIKIEHPKDLPFLQYRNIHPMIIAYLSDHLGLLMKSNHCNDLSEIGAIYFLESLEDSKKHIELGLFNSLEKSLPEFTELITLKNSKESIKLLHSCFVISNSCAISVFAEIGILDKSTENYLLQDSEKITIEIN